MRQSAAVRRIGPQLDARSPAFASSGQASTGRVDVWPVDPAPVGGRLGRPARAVATLGALLLLLAIAKPWGQASSPATTGSALGDLISAALPTAPPVRAPAVRYTTPPLAPADLAAAELCRWPSGWRVFAHQNWLGKQVRSWTAMRPIVASRPGDPTIPVVRLRSEAIPLLGFCAPVGGAASASATASARARASVSAVGSPAPAISVWRVEDDAPPVPVPVARVDPDAPSALGSLLAPLERGRQLPTWPPGHYVFRVSEAGPAAGASPGWWWAVEVSPPQL